MTHPRITRIALLAASLAACAGSEPTGEPQPAALADVMEIAVLVPFPERAEVTLEGGGAVPTMRQERDSTGQPYVWSFGEGSLRFDQTGHMAAFITLKVRREVGSQCAAHVPIEFQRPVPPLQDQAARQRLVLSGSALDKVTRYARLYYDARGAVLLDRRDIAPAPAPLGDCP